MKPSMTWGWWMNKPNNPIPVYLGDDKRNIVLSVEELKEYDKLLVEMIEQVQQERQAVYWNLRAIEKRHHSELLAGRGAPRCTALPHALQFMVTMAKQKLAMLKFMCKLTKRAADVYRH